MPPSYDPSYFDREQSLIKHRILEGMRFPTVQVSALREWIDEIAEVANLNDRERVAKLNAGHTVKLRGPEHAL
jgi:hypothetical protein